MTESKADRADRLARRALVLLDGAERGLWLHELALRGQFRELRPKPGERIAISKGAEKVRAGSGFDYWPFAVSAPGRPIKALGWDDPLLGDGEEGRTAAAGRSRCSKIAFSKSSASRLTAQATMLAASA
jgi:hypothetical protein